MSVVVVATIIPLPDYRNEVIATITETVAKVHEEDGCELTPCMADDRLMMVEKWASPEALRAQQGHGPGRASPLAGGSPGRPRSSSCGRCRATRPRDSCEETG